MGAWFTGRNERYALNELHKREDRQMRVDAAVQFLVAYRRYVNYILIDDPNVTLAPGRPAGKEVVHVHGSRNYLNATQEAVGRLELLEGGRGGDSRILRAAEAVRLTSLHVAVARAATEQGALPDDVVLASGDALTAFCQITARELGFVKIT